jgi:hypothetical protein
MLKTEADPLELRRDDLTIQLEDDVAELAESEAPRSTFRQPLGEVKQLLACLFESNDRNAIPNLDHL